jgi:hypothetical protein
VPAEPMPDFASVATALQHCSCSCWIHLALAAPVPPHTIRFAITTLCFICKMLRLVSEDVVILIVPDE